MTPLQENILITLEKNSSLCFRDFSKAGYVRTHRHFQNSIKIFITKDFIKGYMRRINGERFKRKYYELTPKGSLMAKLLIRLRA